MQRNKEHKAGSIRSPKKLKFQGQHTYSKDYNTYSDYVQKNSPEKKNHKPLDSLVCTRAIKMAVTQSSHNREYYKKEIK